MRAPRCGPFKDGENGKQQNNGARIEDLPLEVTAIGLMRDHRGLMRGDAIPQASVTRGCGGRGSEENKGGEKITLRTRNSVEATTSPSTILEMDKVERRPAARAVRSIVYGPPVQKIGVRGGGKPAPPRSTCT